MANQALLDKYHNAINRLQTIQDEYKRSKDEWKAMETRYKTIEKNIRELCESILAKDPKEMKLGEEYSWGSIDLIDLVPKSRAVYNQYIKNNTTQLKKLMEDNENRRIENEDLKKNLFQLKTNPHADRVITTEEFEESAKDEKGKGSAKESNLGIIAVLDNTNAYNKDEGQLMEAVENDANRVQLTPTSIPKYPNRKAVENKREQKEREKALEEKYVTAADIESESDMLIIKDLWGALSKTEKNILKVIGETGLSLYQDIAKTALSQHKIKDSGSRGACSTMTSSGILTKKDFVTALSKKTAYVITKRGIKVYRHGFGKAPVKSQFDIIVGEHDNEEHGYNIKETAAILRKKEIYKSVTDMNRKNPIPLRNGTSYIPDIICVEKNDKKDYIEFECANHTQTDFNSKCQKMSEVTNTLNFICPNEAAAQKINEQVKKWLKNRKGGRNVFVRVTTVKNIGDNMNMLANHDWKYVFNSKNGFEPTVNF